MVRLARDVTPPRPGAARSPHARRSQRHHQNRRAAAVTESRETSLKYVCVLCCACMVPAWLFCMATGVMQCSRTALSGTLSSHAGTRCPLARLAQHGTHGDVIFSSGRCIWGPFCSHLQFACVLSCPADDPRTSPHFPTSPSPTTHRVADTHTCHSHSLLLLTTATPQLNHTQHTHITTLPTRCCCCC